MKNESTIIGIDTGGTFTDFVYIRKGKIHVLKVLSTPENPGKAIFQGLQKIQNDGEFPYSVTHGSTVATNALLERKGAKTALITTRGFKDLIEIGRQNRASIYDLNVDRPEPLIPSQLRYEITERTTKSGEVLHAIEESELEIILSKLERQKIKSIAVCLLHSYLNNTHELKIAKAGRRKRFNVSPSSEILPEYREYERFSTTTVNAYVAPVMDGYLDSIQKKLGKTGLRIMKSNGGIISAKTARKESVHTILSGPAGGVVGAFEIGKKAGFDNLLTFDMGGTSTDVSLCSGGIITTSDSVVAGCPIKIPVINIHTVGAGGGSIASLDTGGALKVGPASAGSNPGPVCYGKGKKLTVTDANLTLGRLDKGHFLGGEMKIYAKKMQEVFNDTAKKYKMHAEELASGIIKIVNSNMEKALRVISIEKGYNPAEFALVSFGGAGSLHAAELARELNIMKVIIPQNPGIYSAMGMLFSDYIKDYSQTALMLADGSAFKKMEKKFRTLEARAIKEMLSEDVSEDKITVRRFVDVRYKGQSYELTFPYGMDYVKKFHAAHESRYGFADRKRIVEVVNVRLKCIGVTDHPKLQKKKSAAKANAKQAIIGKRKVYDGSKFVGTDIYNREFLFPRMKATGPAIIHEYSSTTYVPPDFVFTVDAYLNVILTRK